MHGFSQGGVPRIPVYDSPFYDAFVTTYRWSDKRRPLAIAIVLGNQLDQHGGAVVSITACMRGYSNRRIQGSVWVSWPVNHAIRATNNRAAGDDLLSCGSRCRSARPRRTADRGTRCAR